MEEGGGGGQEGEEGAVRILSRHSLQQQQQQQRLLCLRLSVFGSVFSASTSSSSRLNSDIVLGLLSRSQPEAADVDVSPLTSSEVKGHDDDGGG
ncbi:hypothetical protein INR49_008144 [Caranx melampygus]|nr:hypothetical protein INR49_008144 [Caranx melampygus]